MVNSGSTKNSGDGQRSELTAEELLLKLRTALKKDGDFPASAKVVTELRMLTSDPKTTANQITEVILREPSLGTRVLHLVNSTYFRRAKPIMTVSQAVVQIGMKPLAEMCAGLVLLQKFVPAARRGGAFAECIQKTIVTSLLSSTITNEIGVAKGKSNEAGYLAGSFAEIGTLLLGYYFPQIYENAVKRAQTKNLKISQAIKEITGVSATQLSLEVVSALELPPFYREVLLQSEPSLAATYPSSSGDKISALDKSQLADVGKAVVAAKGISHTLVFSKDRAELDTVLKEAKATLGIDPKKFDTMVGQLPDLFKTQCASLDINLPALPDYVAHYADSGTVAAEKKDGTTDNFSHFVEEIRQAVQSREPTSSIITTVMETLAWGLKFDRVLLMLATSGKKKLVGRMLLGKVEGFSPREFERPLGDAAESQSPDAIAFAESRPVFAGESIFDDGWPFAALPIGFGPRAIGVIYADRTNSENEISGREQAALGVLAELLDRSIQAHA